MPYTAWACTTFPQLETAIPAQELEPALHSLQPEIVIHPRELELALQQETESRDLHPCTGAIYLTA